MTRLHTGILNERLLPQQAAEIPVELGYTNIKEFGGIIDWTYEVESVFGGVICCTMRKTAR